VVAQKGESVINLNGRKVSRELNVVSGSPEIEGVQSLVREAFKSHVGRRDSGLRI